MGKVAQVGMNRPASLGDISRIAQAQELVGSIIFGEPDPVNLLNGRDFLTEHHRYDAVVLHSIFHTHAEYLRHVRENPVMAAQISPRHSIARWRRRLIATRARFIVVFETLPMSLNGWQLGDLPGYRIKEREGRYTVYEREGDG